MIRAVLACLLSVACLSAAPDRMRVPWDKLKPGNVIACRKCEGTKKVDGRPCKLCDARGGFKVVLCPDCDGEGFIEEADLNRAGKWLPWDICSGCSGRGMFLVPWKYSPPK